MRLVDTRWVARWALLVGCAATSLVIAQQPAERRQQLPPPEWVDSNREAPHGTRYATFNSNALKGDVSYLVYLPPDYDTQTSARYPVIYWLHGLGGNQRGGATVFVPHVDRAIRSGELPPTIVVVVNGMRSSFYCDWANGDRPMESVIVNDLIPHVDKTYRTIAKREGRLVEGYSMGGFGAAHLAFKYPDVFGAVVVDAGALIPAEAFQGPNLNEIYQGAFAGDKDRMLAEHPMQLVVKHADKIRGRMKIRIGCGDQDTLLERNRELHELLYWLKIDDEYEVVAGVGHASPRYYELLGTKGLAFHKQAFAALTK